MTETELAANAGEPTATFRPLRAVVSLQDQTERLSYRKLIVIFVALAFSLFISFFDSTSVATAYTKIAEDLQAGETIVWVGTAYLIANTSSQLIYGRLSDIFGRKHCLMGALAIFGFSDLLCGFAQTPIQLYVFRAFAGVGAGGINNMAMVIMSDVTSLRDRNRWQGYITAAIAAGSAAGPFVGAALSAEVGWRYLFWIMTPCAAVCMAVSWWFIPLRPVTGSIRSKLLKVDYLGCVVSLAANCCLLVAIASGGSLYPWSSPVVIALLVVGTLLWVLFGIVEWKIAKLPVLPPRLFTYRSPAIVITSFFLIGFVYYINLFFLPRYFQTLLGMSSTTSAAMLLALLLVQTFSSFFNGQITRFSGQVKSQIMVGFVLFMIGVGLETTFDLNTSRGQIAGFLVIQGLGTGGVIGSALVAAQAGAPPADRAVVTAARNFTRTFGGSFGLAIANAVLQNTLTSKLPSDLPAAVRSAVIHGATLANLPDSLDTTTRTACYAAYEQGLKWIWIMLCPAIAICLIASVFIQRDELYDSAKLAAAPVSAGSPEKTDIEKGVGTVDDEIVVRVASPPDGSQNECSQTPSPTLLSTTNDHVIQH